MAIKLGKFPSTVQVKISISVSKELKDRLDQYAKLHSSTWGEQVDTATIIPHMLREFMDSDREFRRFSESSRIIPD